MKQQLSAIAIVPCLIAVCHAAPYRPAADAEVLETLPRVLFETRDQLTTWRRQLAERPDDLDVAVQVASAYVLIGKREGDPRFYGYARAALEPWWNQKKPPLPVLKLRAKLKERDHEYDAALADQRLVLEAAPQDIQAWIEVANLNWVKGRYDKSREACEQLAAFAPTLWVILCRTPTQAVTGRAEEA